MSKSSLYYYENTRESGLLRAFREAANTYAPVKAGGYALKKNVKSPNRVLTALLSDLHFGTDLIAGQHLVPFGKIEEARRLAYVLQNILHYKTDKRDTTVLHLDINGDLFAGLLGHDDRAVAELTHQIMRASHLLSQLVIHCAEHFPKVVINVQPGNHGRNLLRHKTRQDNDKWENFETIVMFHVRGVTRNLKNITWNMPKRSWSDIPVFNWHKFMTHGDTILGKKPGTPAFESIVNATNSSPYYRSGGYDIYELGHWHAPENFLMGRSHVFVNGALLPPDGHSESSGYLNKSAQWLYESTEKFAVGDQRLVVIDSTCHADTSLDALISPWTEDLVFSE